MTDVKKLILIATGMVYFWSTAAIAEEEKKDKIPVVTDLEVKLSGFAHFQAAYRNQSELNSEEKNVSNHRKDFAFYNDSAMAVNISNQINDAKYGAKIVLVPTTKRKGGASFNGSHIYVESDFGKVEMGSPNVPSSTMMVDGSDIAAGSSSWDRYARTDTEHLKQGVNYDPSFATSSDFFLDCKLTTKLGKRAYSGEPSRGVVYYTPKFQLAESTKLSMGVGYIPDTSNTGADNPDTHCREKETKKIDDATAHPGIYKFEIDNAVKNVFTGGVNLEHNFTDGVDLKIALTGEYGKASGKAKTFEREDSTEPNGIHKLSDLKTYNIGAVLNVGNFSYAGSYGSLGKSLTTPEFHKTGRKTDYYSGAVAYKQGPFAASLSYFKSNQFKNTVDAITIGTNYQLAPGFKPYVEVTSFALKGKPEFDKNLPKKKTRGTVALIGAKLSL
jgi:hypothetical protein